MSLTGHNDKRHHRRLGASLLQPVIETSQRLDKEVAPFISELVTASDEEIQRVVEVKVVVAVKVTADKLVDFLLFDLVQVLELVHRLEFDHVQPVRQYPVGFTLKQVFQLVSGNMGHRGEHIGGVSGTAFNAVTVVNTPLTGFNINVKLVQIIVEVRQPRTEVAP